MRVPVVVVVVDCMPGSGLYAANEGAGPLIRVVAGRVPLNAAVQ